MPFCSKVKSVIVETFVDLWWNDVHFNWKCMFSYYFIYLVLVFPYRNEAQEDQLVLNMRWGPRMLFLQLHSL